MGNDGSKRSGFFSGFVLGGIVGAIMAFFLSHKADRESFKSKLGGMVARGRESIRDAIEEGKEAAARKEAELRADMEKEKDK